MLPPPPMPPALGDGSVVANGVFNITLADGWVPIASAWLAVGSLPLVASMLVLLAAVVTLGCKRFLSRREERETHRSQKRREETVKLQNMHN